MIWGLQSGPSRVPPYNKSSLRLDDWSRAHGFAVQTRTCLPAALLFFSCSFCACNQVASILDAIEEARRSRSSLETPADELAAGADAKSPKPDSAAANADFMGALRLSDGVPATAPIGDPRDGSPESPDGNGHMPDRAPPIPDMPDWGVLRALHSASSDTLSLREGQRGSLRLLGTEVEQHTPRCVPPAEPFGGADAAQTAGPATEQETVVAAQMAAAAKKLGALTDSGLTGLRCRTSMS